ncbi:MAG: putative transposase, partial [Pseudonocardiaceae bacterium]
ETPAQETPAQETPAQETPAQETPAQVGRAGRVPPGGLRLPACVRIATGVHRSRYAGAMLVHPYLHMVGAESILAGMTGGPARRYDDLAVLTTATFGFALGIDTVEGVKHLSRAEAGAALGLARIPELATLRARLGALADGGDPLGLQRAFAAAMLRTDPADAPVYFVDDHFVPYAGARPVAKGWNTKRRHAEPGRDDTLLVDARGRAVVFDSSEPTALSTTLPGVLAQLRRVLGPNAPITLAFDRGGAQPVTFRACRDAGAHWLTYRRAPLAATTATPAQYPITRGDKVVTVTLADETVQITGYGSARQLSLYEHDTLVLQVLTSDTTASAPDLLWWLRARWRIENFFKYAAEHNGIDSLADYVMDIAPDDRKVPNPARAAARKTLTDAQSSLAGAERALAQLLSGPAAVSQTNAALPAAHADITAATAAVTAAKTALKPIPAKIAITDLDPDARRAHPRLQRRGLQMVLRLLAYNAEAWLAEHFNTYLNDGDEHRAILRHLLHLGGHITYTPDTITITLDRPDTPRVARALTLLTEELNTKAATMPGDHRPLTYHISATP